MSSQTSTGMVILAGTPIGDTASASPRLVQTLQGAQVIAAEDTRRLTDLLHRLQISTSARVVSYFEGNEAARTQELLEALLAGQDVVVVTDAGMPSVSDPGFRLVSAAIEHGVRVTSVPGPTAVTTALAISGMPTDRFCFEGFLPRKRGERRRRLQELVDETRTTVLYEAPHRVTDLLHDAVEILGAQRHAAICRELTKTYEEVHRGTLAQLRDWVEQGVRGEITLVLAGATAQTVSLADAVGMVDEVVADGEKTSRAVAGIAARTGLRRRELYDAFLAARRAGAGASQSGDGHAEAPDQPSAE